MNLFLSCTALLALLANLVTGQVDTLKIYSIVVVPGTVPGGHYLASQAINNDSSILPNYNIEVEVLNCQRSGVVALRHALDVISYSADSMLQDNHTATVPFLLGCPWSSLSMMTAAALNAFDYGQISSVSTAVLLSKQSNYPHFYRLTPDDSMQAEGLILLCQTFGWTAVTILHDNDAYGTYLAVATLERATRLGIGSRAVAYQRGDTESVNNAIRAVKNLGIFIVLLIAHGSDLSTILEAAQQNEIWGYPYYYVGVDGWMSQNIITGEALESRTEGFIGIVPWQAGSMAPDAYSGDLLTMYENSLEFKSKLSSMWEAQYNENPIPLQNVSAFGNSAAYGFDALYSLARALHIFDEQYNLHGVFNGTYTDRGWILDELSNILENDVQFYGATGNVDFDENGNRANGIFGLSNVNADGIIEYFGYFYEEEMADGTLELRSYIDEDLIHWPSYFNERGMTPRPFKLVHAGMTTVSKKLFFTVLSFASFSAALVIFFYVGVTLIKRESKIISAGSYLLNLIMCGGGLMIFISVIILGVDENFYERGSSSLDSICSAATWLNTIGLTLLFVPMFLKIYRLSVIATSWQENKDLTDTKLLYGLAGFVFMDVLVLCIFAGVENEVRHYYDGELQEIDELQEIQYEFGRCQRGRGGQMNMVFLSVIGVWKFLEMGFGAYSAQVVSKIGLDTLKKFKETMQQLTAIAFTVFCSIILIPVLVFVPAGELDFKFGFVGFISILITNFVLAMNLLPRIMAALKGESEILLDTQQKSMFKAVNEQMKKAQAELNREESRSKYAMSSTSRAASKTKEDPAPTDHTEITAEV